MVYKKRRARLEEARLKRERMQTVVRLSLDRLSEVSGGRASASAVYYFIWVVERVCRRHKIPFHSFGFKVKQGMLTSARLTYILRRMIKEGSLRLEGDYLVPAAGVPVMDRIDTDWEFTDPVADVINKTAEQWSSDTPDEHLVRFVKLFK
ncbi:MAG: hypothetical protein U9N45_06485 [Gemmatimonadota bacterium]|nr:hypothetical protein [Gemmatimonadota bacterium]